MVRQAQGTEKACCPFSVRPADSRQGSYSKTVRTESNYGTAGPFLAGIDGRAIGASERIRQRSLATRVPAPIGSRLRLLCLALSLPTVSVPCRGRAVLTPLPFAKALLAAGLADRLVRGSGVRRPRVSAAFVVLADVLAAASVVWRIRAGLLADRPGHLIPRHRAVNGANELRPGVHAACGLSRMNAARPRR
jgi:hypothetical protein